KTIHPVGKTFHPVGKTIHPVGKTILPVGKTIHPVGKTIHLVGKTIHPVGKTILPRRKTILPRRKTILPCRVHLDGNLRSNSSQHLLNHRCRRPPWTLLAPPRPRAIILGNENILRTLPFPVCAVFSHNTYASDANPTFQSA